VQVNPKAGKLADPSELVNVPKLITAYFTEHPDPSIREQRVSFGTSGHRGSALKCSFNEDHILAISQAICEYRKRQKTEGPLLILDDNLREDQRVPYARARSANTTHSHNYVAEYAKDLEAVVDMAVIQRAGVKIGVDPLGGASVAYWGPIRDRYHLNLTVVNELVDPTFRFMTVDWDGKVRMDCSSRFAMASLIERKGSFDVAFANDTDADRHGIVTREGGLMNPNHYLAVAIDYLFQNRPGWSATAAVGKIVVSSSLIDHVA